MTILRIKRQLTHVDQSKMDAIEQKSFANAPEFKFSCFTQT